MKPQEGRLVPMLSTDPIDVLMVEDNPGDVELTRQAFRKAKVPSTFHVVGDGEDAISFLRRQGDHKGVPRPHLVLLDLNLPRKNGHEVLAEIKHDPDFDGIPVVIMTGSQDDRDIEKIYDLHPSCYVTKPQSLDQFVILAEFLANLWLTEGEARTD